MEKEKGKIPAFFKVFIPELCSKKMQIPPAFTSIMKGKLPDTAAFLRSRRGNVWAVDMSRDARNLYFDGGWVRFVKDNDVEMGDFLVFQLTRDHIYDFKHLGHSGCEKETVGSFKFIVKAETLDKVMEGSEEEEEYDDEEEEEVEEDDDEDGEEEEEEEKDDEDYEEEEEEEEEKDDEDYEEEEEEEEKDEEEGIEFETSSSCVKKAGKSTYRNKGKAGVEREAGSKNSVTVKGVEDIFASGLIDLPKNPYFVVPPRKRRDLRIPYEVITDHQLNIPEEIIISSEDGWEFVAAVSTWVDGRKVIVDGWRKFCERNKVTEEDCCLCEFLPPQSHKLLVRALHFHKGKWIPRP